MRRSILAAGLIFVVLGLAAMVNGWTFIQVERGWAQFIAGSVLLGTGALLVGMSAVVARLEALASIFTLNPASETNYEPAPVPETSPAAFNQPDESPERPVADASPSPVAMPLETFRPPVSVEAIAPTITEASDESPVASADKRIPIGALAGAASAVAGAALASTMRRTDMMPALSETPPPPYAPPPSAPPPYAPPPSAPPPPPSFAPPPRPSFTPPAPPQPFSPPPFPSLMPPPLPTAQGSPETRRAATEFEERLLGVGRANPLDAPAPAILPEFDAPAQDGRFKEAEELEESEAAEAETHETPPAVESAFYAEPEEPPPVLGPVGDPEFSEELEEIRHAPAEPEPVEEAPVEAPALEIDEMAWLDAALRGVEMPKEPEWVAKPVVEPAEPVDFRPPPTPEPPLPETTPSEEPEAESKGNVVRTYESQGVIYNLYDNGSVDAETPNGLFHFTSVDELREFLAKSA